MYIALYISSHGFGHMTRCLGIMENILHTSDYNLYIVCGKRQNDFARIYLAEYKDRINVWLKDHEFKSVNEYLIACMVKDGIIPDCKDWFFGFLVFSICILLFTVGILLVYFYDAIFIRIKMIFQFFEPINKKYKSLVYYFTAQNLDHAMDHTSKI